MNIGVEQHTNLVYEGPTNLGYPLWPSPVMLQVVIASEEDELFTAAKFNDVAPRSLLFREDAYDSSSRVRRGRLYQAGSPQPVEWHVYAHPAIPNEMALAERNGGTIKKQLNAFSSFRLRAHLENGGYRRPLFILGAENGFTVWSLVNVETSVTGDEIVSLRARKSIGALPHLDREKISEADGKPVLDKVEKLEEDLFRAGPESIVDRSRDAATAILSKYLQTLGKPAAGKDLGKLARMIGEEGLDIVASSAGIIARFHARGKHAEQEKRKFRAICEQDAELAVQALGTILCDLGWARW